MAIQFRFSQSLSLSHIIHRVLPIIHTSTQVQLLPYPLFDLTYRCLIGYYKDPCLSWIVHIKIVKWNALHALEGDTAVFKLCLIYFFLFVFFKRFDYIMKTFERMAGGQKGICMYVCVYVCIYVCMHICVTYVRF